MKKTILIIDDSAEDRFLYKRFLSEDIKESYDFIEVENGVEAESFINKGGLFDIMLLDYQLPDTDGLTLLKQLGQSITDKPVVFLTGYGSETIAVNSMKQGVFDYLSKTALTGELLQTTVRLAYSQYQLTQKEEEQKRFLRTFIDTIPNPIFFANMEGRYQVCNEAFKQLFSLKQEQLFEMACAENQSEETGRLLNDLWHTAGKASKSHPHEFHWENSGNLTKTLLVHGAHFFDDHNEPTGTVGILTDVTHRIEMEKELRLANQAKDRFFSIIAHDLRGPIGSLVEILSLLYEDEQFKKNLSEDTSNGQFFPIIIDTAKNAFELLENLLLWSRSQTGGMDILVAPVQPYQIAKVVVELLQTQLTQKNISVLNQIDTELVGLVDENVIHTVFRNLTSNAIKFSPSGSQLILSARVVSDTIEISVSDEGVGIPESSSEKLFKIDQKLTTSGTNGEQGTGLGLVLCAELLSKCGGTIWHQPNSPAGSVFSFSILHAGID